jgi:tetratricopeptide (TPR) repeat protein
MNSKPSQIQNPSSKLSNIMNYKINKLSAERIVELAHWAQFEESSKWLSRVSYLLLLAGQNKEAVVFAERSVATGTEDPGLVADLAVSYAANHQYKKAIDTLLLSQELISDNNEGLRRVNFTRLSRYQERLGDIDAAIESYARALDGLEVPEALSVTQNFLRLLLTHRKYDQALQIVESLSNTKNMGTSDSALVDFYWQLMDEADIHQELISLAVETDSLEAVAEFYRRGLRAFVHFDILGIRSAFRFYYAVLHLRLFQQDKAVRLLEAVVDDPQLSLGTKRYEWMRWSAEFILAVVYLDKALTAQRYDNLQTTEEVVGRLTELAQHERAAKSTRLPAVILGVWHRINGRTEAARACIRGSVMLGVDLLTDDTDENDVEGWSTLGIGLLAAGDNQNALMVVLYCKQLGMNSAATGRSESVGEDEYTDKEPAKATRDANGQGENEQKTTREDPADYECDGCHKGIRASQEMHRCSYCLSVDFCEDCYGLYTAGNLPINVCGRHHEFIHVPPVLEAYPRGLIKAGDVYRETSVWLEELRETWAATD